MPSPQPLDRYAVADRLHSATIHLLRRLRRVDEATGLSAPKLSALSVLVFGGRKKLGELAEVEQVRPATMSRLVRELESDGFITRRPDAEDGRVVYVSATPKANRLLKKGRSERVKLLASWLEPLNREQITALEDAVRTMAHLGRQDT